MTPPIGHRRVRSLSAPDVPRDVNDAARAQAQQQHQQRVDATQSRRRAARVYTPVPRPPKHTYKEAPALGANLSLVMQGPYSTAARHAHLTAWLCQPPGEPQASSLFFRLHALRVLLQNAGAFQHVVWGIAGSAAKYQANTNWSDGVPKDIDPVVIVVPALGASLEGVDAALMTCFARTFPTLKLRKLSTRDGDIYLAKLPGAKSRGTSTDWGATDAPTGPCDVRIVVGSGGYDFVCNALVTYPNDPQSYSTFFGVSQALCLQDNMQGIYRRDHALSNSVGRYWRMQCKGFVPAEAYADVYLAEMWHDITDRARFMGTPLNESEIAYQVASTVTSIMKAAGDYSVQDGAAALQPVHLTMLANGIMDVERAQGGPLKEILLDRLRQTLEMRWNTQDPALLQLGSLLRTDGEARTTLAFFAHLLQTPQGDCFAVARRGDAQTGVAYQSVFVPGCQASMRVTFPSAGAAVVLPALPEALFTACSVNSRLTMRELLTLPPAELLGGPGADALWPNELDAAAQATLARRLVRLSQTTVDLLWSARLLIVSARVAPMHTPAAWVQHVIQVLRAEAGDPASSLPADDVANAFAALRSIVRVQVWDIAIASLRKPSLTLVERSQVWRTCDALLTDDADHHALSGRLERLDSVLTTPYDVEEAVAMAILLGTVLPRLRSDGTALDTLTRLGWSVAAKLARSEAPWQQHARTALNSALQAMPTNAFMANTLVALADVDPTAAVRFALQHAERLATVPREAARQLFDLLASHVGGAGETREAEHHLLRNLMRDRDIGTRILGADSPALLDRLLASTENADALIELALLARRPNAPSVAALLKATLSTPASRAKRLVRILRGVQNGDLKTRKTWTVALVQCEFMRDEEAWKASFTGTDTAFQRYVIDVMATDPALLARCVHWIGTQSALTKQATGLLAHAAVHWVRKTYDRMHTGADLGVQLEELCELFAPTPRGEHILVRAFTAAPPNDALLDWLVQELSDVRPLGLRLLTLARVAAQGYLQRFCQDDVDPAHIEQRLEKVSDVVNLYCVLTAFEVPATLEQQMRELFKRDGVVAWLQGYFAKMVDPEHAPPSAALVPWARAYVAASRDTQQREARVREVKGHTELISGNSPLHGNGKSLLQQAMAELRVSPDAPLDAARDALFETLDELQDEVLAWGIVRQLRRAAAATGREGLMRDGLQHLVERAISRTPEKLSISSARAYERPFAQSCVILGEPLPIEPATRLDLYARLFTGLAQNTQLSGLYWGPIAKRVVDGAKSEGLEIPSSLITATVALMKRKHDPIMDVYSMMGVEHWSLVAPLLQVEGPEAFTRALDHASRGADAWHTSPTDLQKHYLFVFAEALRVSAKRAALRQYLGALQNETDTRANDVRKQFLSLVRQAMFFSGKFSKEELTSVRLMEVL